MGDLELKCFNIISNVGSARSFYIEAIQYAKNEEFEKAEKSMNEGEEAYLEGHHSHAELIQQECSGEAVPVSLILLHAEDQLMSADGFKIIAREFIDLYKKISK